MAKAQVTKKHSKSEIIDCIYERTGYDKVQICRILDVFIDEIPVLAAEAGKVVMMNFGTFHLHARDTRKNMRLGQGGKRGKTASACEDDGISFHLTFTAAKNSKALLKCSDGQAKRELLAQMLAERDKTK